MHSSSPYDAPGFSEAALRPHRILCDAETQRRSQTFSCASRGLAEAFPAVYAGKYEIKREDRRPRRFAFISCGGDLLLEMPDFSTVVLIPVGNDSFVAGPTGQKFDFHRNASGMVTGMSVADVLNVNPEQNRVAQRVVVG